MLPVPLTISDDRVSYESPAASADSIFCSEPRTLKRPMAMITERYGRRWPPPMAASRSPNDRNRQMQRCRGRMRANRRDANDPGEQSAQANGHHAAGNSPLESHAAEIGEHDNAEGGETDDGPRERSIEKAEGDKAQSDAGKRGEQRRARRDLADALGDERQDQLNDAGAERRQTVRPARRRAQDRARRPWSRAPWRAASPEIHGQ